MGSILLQQTCRVTRLPQSLVRNKDVSNVVHISLIQNADSALRGHDMHGCMDHAKKRTINIAIMRAVYAPCLVLENGNIVFTGRCTHS